jgi:hypothetical protein
MSVMMAIDDVGDGAGQHWVMDRRKLGHNRSLTWAELSH